MGSCCGRRALGGAGGCENRVGPIRPHTLRYSRRVTGGLDELRAQRFAFLKALYDATEGSTRALVAMDAIGERLGFDRQHSTKLADYLADEDLLRFAAAGPMLEITPWSVKEVEEALNAPEEPTEHFLPIVLAQNYLQVGTMSHSQVQQGTTSSTQVQRALDVDALRDLVAQLRAITPELDLEAEENDEYEADIETLAAQLRSPRPKVRILRESLSSVRTIFEGAAGAGVAAGAAHLPHLIDEVTRAITSLPV
jgi:hypothetical protein